MLSGSRPIHPGPGSRPMVRHVECARSGLSAAASASRCACFAALIGLASAPAGAGSSPIAAFAFDGRVTAVTDEAGTISSLVNVGDPLVLTVVLDAAAQDREPDPRWGAYLSAGEGFGLELRAGSLSLGSGDLWLFIGDDVAPGTMDIVRFESAFENRAGEPRVAVFAQLLMLDDSGSALRSDALPASRPEPAHFSTARQFVLTGAGFDGGASFTLLAEIAEAPSPISAAPLLAAVVAAFGTRRTRPEPVSR